MAGPKAKSLRSLRKARHGWFDYEVVDIFGDELGPYGCMVYMVLARWCYGGTRVCKSLRDMEELARMGKDKVSQSLKKLEQIGLIVVHKGPTSRSPSCFDICDVKDLVEDLRSSGHIARVLRSSGVMEETYSSTVCVADSRGGDDGGGPQGASGDGGASNPPADVGDSSSGSLLDGGGIVDLEASAAVADLDMNCLPHRQMGEEVENDGFEALTVRPQRQMRTSTQTYLSATADALIKQEERNKKEETTPLPPVPGELVLPVGDCVVSDPQFVLCVGIAARWLMGRCGISDQRQEKTIVAALEQRCRLNSETLQAATKLAADNAADYQQCLGAGLLRIQWGWPKFFGHGHWQFPATWPIDEAKLREMRRASNASTGMFRG